MHKVSRQGGAQDMRIGNPASALCLRMTNALSYNLGLIKQKE